MADTRNIDRIFVINLERDVEKKHHMQSILDGLTSNYEMFPAIDGSALDSETKDSFCNQASALRVMGRRLSNGEIGCALSHSEIYKKIITENIERALILEDDVIIDFGFNQIIGNVAKLPQDWDCVLLCYYRNSAFKRSYFYSVRGQIRLTDSYKSVRFIDVMHSTAGYLINRNGAMKILKALESGLHMPIDHYTGDDRIVNLYGIYPPPIQIHPHFGFLSNIAIERNLARGGVYNDKIKLGECLRRIMKKFGVFSFFKKVNLLRIRMMMPLSQWLYCVTHCNKIFSRLKSYQ